MKNITKTQLNMNVLKQIAIFTFVITTLLIPTNDAFAVSRSEAESAVKSAYQSCLGRSADSSGLNHHVNLILGGKSASQVKKDICNSQEAKNYADRGNSSSSSSSSSNSGSSSESTTINTLSCPFSPSSTRTVVQMSDRLRSDSGSGRAFSSKSVSLPAGNYKITLFTYDSYSSRGNVSQPNEKLSVQFKSGGNVVAQSGTSPDLADNRVTATWQGVVNNSLNFGQSVDQVIFRNAAYPDTSSPNSLGGCVAIDRLSSPTPPNPNPRDFDVQCRVSDTRVEVGEHVTFTADVDGGNSPFDYDWSGDVNGNNIVEVESFNRDGSYHVDVTVWDDDGNVARDDCPTVVVDDNYDNDDFDIQCVISDTSIEVGDRVTIEVDIDGGNSPYNIEWDGDIDDIDGFDDNDRSQRVELDREGRYDLEVEVTDDDGYRRTDDCTIRVSDDDNRGIYVTTNTTPTGNLSGLNSVFLNQIPYTGPREDLMKILSFTFLLMIWSAIIATVFYKRRQKALQSERINAFKEANRLG